MFSIKRYGDGEERVDDGAKQEDEWVNYIHLHACGWCWLVGDDFRLHRSHGCGISIPVMLIVTSKLSNNIGGGANSDNFTHNINKRDTAGQEQLKDKLQD
ncbi:hypothetical protein LguiB_010284 [Lonicera macranthoides]